MGRIVRGGVGRGNALQSSARPGKLHAPNDRRGHPPGGRPRDRPRHARHLHRHRAPWPVRRDRERPRSPARGARGRAPAGERHTSGREGGIARSVSRAGPLVGSRPSSLSAIIPASCRRELALQHPLQNEKLLTNLTESTVSEPSPNIAFDTATPPFVTFVESLFTRA